jgi:thiol-disulfide isomerase/thioredoxin
MAGPVPEGHVLAGDADWDPAPTGAPTHGRRRLWWPLAALLALAAIAGVLAWRAAPTADAVSGYIATPGWLSVAAPDQRLASPRLRGELLDGKTFDSASLSGNIIVVNFWGSWCPPCRAETPELVRVANATHDQGVRFMGVDVRDNRASAQAFALSYDVPYPSIFDSDNQSLLAFRGLPPTAVPTTFLLDRQGRIAARALGRINEAQLTAALKTLTQEPPATSKR